MAFSDPDPIEEHMGIRCEEMSPEQLVSYIKTYHRAYGLELPVDGVKERSVFRSLQNFYGQGQAGQIVKWVFYKHKGKYRGEPVTYFDFIKARRWFTDMMYRELQAEHDRDAARTKPRKSSVGSASLSDL